MNQTKRKLLSAALAMVMTVQTALPTAFAMESEEPAAKTITGFTALAQTDYTLPIGADEDTISHVLTFPEAITAKVEYITTEEVTIPEEVATPEDEVVEAEAPTTTLVQKLVSEQVELAVAWESDSALTTEEVGEFTYTAVLDHSDKGKYNLAEGVSLPQITVYVEAAQPTLLCLCATLCIEGSSNPDCNICAAEGADLAECKGESPMPMMSPLALGDPVADFASLKAAVSAAPAGATITLGADITADENLIINKALTLNLNGQTLSMQTKYIDVTTAVNFTVTDSSTSAAGKITSKHMCVIKNSAAGTVTVNGGTVTGISGSTIWNSNTGTVTVNGGTVSATYGSTAIGNDMTGAVNVTGGTVTADTGKAIYNFGTGTVNVTGGTVSATANEGTAIYNNSTGKITIRQATGKATLVTSVNTSTTAGTIYLATVPDSGNKNILTISGGTVSNTASPEGYSVYFNPSEVTLDNLGDYYTKNGGTVGKVKPGITDFASLKEAVSTAPTGATITLGADITAEESLIINKALTLNLAGQSLDMNGFSINVTTGNLTVSGSSGTITGSGSQTIQNTGTVNISGGTVTTSDDIAIQNNGTVNVSGGTVSATGSEGIAIYSNSTGTVNVSGGTVSATGSDGIAIQNNGTGAINVSGGTVSATGSEGIAIYSNSIGKITISQAAGKATLVTSTNTTQNKSTIYLNAVPDSVPKTVLEITGGTVSNTGSEGIAILNNGIGTINVSGGKVYATGKACAITNFTTGTVNVSGGTVYTPDEASSTILNNGAGTVNVSGGTVTTDGNAAIDNVTNGTVNVSGGTVSANRGVAITNSYYDEYGIGKITISQAEGKTTLVTSANEREGTIFLYSVPTSGDLVVLEITGGTISNTASPEGYSVYFSPSEVTWDNLGDYYTKNGGTVGKVHPAITDFASLKAAASTASAGATLTLGAGTYTATESLSINKTLSLDLNGQILDIKSFSINITNEGSLTVTDTSSDSGKITGSTTTISNDGVVSVNSGTVEATSGGIAIQNNNTGTVNVSGGAVTTDSGDAIYNDADGAVNVSAGTVTTGDGTAIYNNSTGKITISQAAGKTTLVTSAFPNDDGGTIYLNAVPGSSPKTVLEIFGGTISNTASPEGYSVYFSPSEVTWDNLGDYYTKNGGTVGKVHPAPPTPPSGGGGSSSGGNITVTTPPATTENPKPATEATTTVKPTASNGTATVTISESVVNNAIAKAQAEAKKNGRTENGINITIKADTGNATSLTANLSKAAIDALVKAGVKETSIQSGVINITLNLEALKEIQKQAGTDVTVTATKVANTTLSAQVKAVIGNRPVYDLRITSKNGDNITNFGDGKVSVSIPYTLGADEKAANVIAYYIDSNGKVEEMPNSAYDTQTKTLGFVTDHFSLYGVGYKANKTTAFTDITNHWAKESIEFVAARGLLAGTGNNKFSPDTSMTRGMFVTALGRLAGAEVSGYTTSSFTDVKAGSYYLGYIEWASKNGIVNGTGNGKFAPDQSISREQMAVIMQNYAKAIGFELPKAHAEILFADHGKISSYATGAVKTMQMAGILAGKNGNKFDPQGTATRAEVSTVLKRFVELVISTDNAQGWMQNDSGKWMFFENGRPVTGTKTIDGTSYTFDANGETAHMPKNLTYGTYTVQKGDSFWSIAWKYKCNLFELARVNDKSVFSIIYPGDELKVPSK